MNKTVNRITTIKISDITEGNREAKFEQLEKCLNGEKTVIIPADNTKIVNNYTAENFTKIF